MMEIQNCGSHLADPGVTDPVTGPDGKRRQI